MIPTKPRLALLAAMILAQLILPARLVYQRVSALEEGARYRFKTEIVDPYDPFRGRYVALYFEPQVLDVAALDPPPDEGDRIFAELDRAADGYARLEDASWRRPSKGDYLAVKVEGVDQDESKAWVALPFDRYYMNERHAPRAESVYRQGIRQGGLDDYVKIRVKEGVAVIDGLYVDDRPIEDWLEETDGEERR